MTGDGRPVLPRRRAPDLSGLAAFTLDSDGRVATWPSTAERMFGHTAEAVIGQDIRDVLMTGPGQRELAADALAEVGTGHVWTATVAMAFAGGSGPVAVRCEPLAGPGSGALVIAQHASIVVGPGWLRRAADRIGTTLDLPRTAREVVTVAVPTLADAATLFVAERLLAADESAAARAGYGSVVRRLASRQVGQAAMVTDELLVPGEVYVLPPDSPSLRAMNTNTPVRFSRLDDDTLQRLAPRIGGQEFATNYVSFLAVPLTARGVVLGCLNFARAATSPDFGPGDVAAADELAARAAVCLDNARLYDRERRTAVALQQGLLPSEPDVPDGIEAASRYLPVGTNRVGGDWHDIIALPNGRAVLIVGDAMGHGPEAAAVMVQLRIAAHTLAKQDLPPEEVLRRLDEMAANLPDAPFATCIVVAIDTQAGGCTMAAAGHPPPVVARPDSPAEVLELPAGLPLGLGAREFEPVQVSLPPGATLALYTDGLVETRSRSLGDGITALQEMLGATLARPDQPLDAGCQSITAALHQSGEDDVTLVLARIRHE